MVRVRPTANVSDWLLSVADVLPIPHREGPPYTLGEAVAELGDYAQGVTASEWNSRPCKRNRSSLREEIRVQIEAIGDQVEDLVLPWLDDLRDDNNQEAVVAAATRFCEEWHSEIAVAKAFHDLCGAAQVEGTTSRALRQLSAVVASQVGPAANSAFSVLGQAADALVSTEEDLARWDGVQRLDPLSEEQRLVMARNSLVAAPAGRVIVWTVYYRALLSGMSEVIGPMTFLRADWALPNAFEIELQDFPEGAELRGIREEVLWLDELHAEALNPENRLTLVRIDLGERQVAGAEEEARRRIEALISVAVQAGGASWQSAGVAAVLLDGKVRTTSSGLTVRNAVTLDDTYGMGGTGEILSDLADQFGDVLARGPMPEQLIEALTSLREARMTDHRDVLFHGVRPVTPRIATALEDHALELFASVMRVPAPSLATALQRRETLSRAGSRIASQLMAPFNEGPLRERYEGREELERSISSYNRAGGRLVSIAKAAALKGEIRALPMSELERADLEDALAICTEPGREQQFLDKIWGETEMLRSRQRRVRNAVNHGLPLHETTVSSIRSYATVTSGTALDIVLTWFKNGDTGMALLQLEEEAWTKRMDRIDRSISWAEDSARSEGLR